MGIAAVVCILLLIRFPFTVGQQRQLYFHLSLKAIP